MRATKFVGWALLWIAAAFYAIWATGALYFDFPVVGFRLSAAILFVVVLLAVTIFVHGKTLRLAAVLASVVLVNCCWLTLKPRNDQRWPPDVAETAWAEIKGDEVTI